MSSFSERKDVYKVFELRQLTEISGQCIEFSRDGGDTTERGTPHGSVGRSATDRENLVMIELHGGALGQLSESEVRAGVLVRKLSPDEAKEIQFFADTAVPVKFEDLPEHVREIFRELEEERKGN